MYVIGFSRWPSAHVGENQGLQGGAADVLKALLTPMWEKWDAKMKFVSGWIQ